MPEIFRSLPGPMPLLLAILILTLSVVESVKLYPLPSQMINMTQELIDKRDALASSEENSEESDDRAALPLRVWISWGLELSIIVCGIIAGILILLRRQLTGIVTSILASGIFVSMYILRREVWDLSSLFSYYERFYIFSVHQETVPTFFVYDVSVPVLYLVALLISAYILILRNKNAKAGLDYDE